jgi:hypothetical protein
MDSFLQLENIIHQLFQSKTDHQFLNGFEDHHTLFNHLIIKVMCRLKQK